jgi:hypothetical protein
MKSAVSDMLIACKALAKTSETGLVMPAVTAGFWRRIAASKVEPDLGRPEMK